MRWGDLLGLSLSALYQQKVRTILSLLGVTIGTLALALSLSVGQGVESAIVRQLRKNDQLRRILVQPSYEAEAADVPAEALKVAGNVSDARRARLRKAIIARWNRDHVTRPKTLLTAEQIRSLAAIEHVRTAIPALDQGGHARFGGKSLEVSMASANPSDEEIRRRIVAGRLFASGSDRSVVVHEYVLYAWGIVTDEEITSMLGRKIRLEYRIGRWGRYPILSFITGGKVEPEAPEHKVLDRLIARIAPLIGGIASDDAERAVARLLLQGLAPPDDPIQEPPVVAEFTIAGVMREAADDDPSPGLGSNWMSRQADILLPHATAQEFFFRSRRNADQGARTVTLTVDAEENVKAVAEVVKNRGFREYSLIPVIEQFRSNVLMITFAIAFIATVALIVAALGITNTMIMGVLERTREIGVMKAVGARDRHIQLVFLVEGASIGLIGGALGLLLTWLASFPGEAIARSIMLKQTHTPPEDSVFVFPLVVTLGVPALACLITTLAAFFPSRRAVKVNPVTALRHE